MLSLIIILVSAVFISYLVTRTYFEYKARVSDHQSKNPGLSVKESMHYVFDHTSVNDLRELIWSLKISYYLGIGKGTTPDINQYILEVIKELKKEFGKYI